MKLYVNDCSFNGQAKSREEAVGILIEVVKIFYHCKTFCCAKKSSIHPEVKNAKIWDEITILEILHDMKNYEKDKKRAILEVFCRSPHYSKNKHIDGETIQDLDGNDLSGTCFDSASISKCGAIVVSAKNSDKYNDYDIEVQSSISGRRKIINLTRYSDSLNVNWIYEPNPKHKKLPLDLGKFIVSEMDLNINEAQNALTNGVFVSKKVISKYKDTWYCFPYHEESVFHGYKITLKQNDTVHSLVDEILNRVNYEPRGQIFYGYV
ncbi:hypothetical protein NUF78_001219 [Yersinia enterocolitica]|nr:hypothetical protein [Yersinia enterocolitica]